MSDRRLDEAVKQPRKKRKPARMPKSRRGRPAKYQYVWQLMADEARLAKRKNQSESVDGVVGAWTPSDRGSHENRGCHNDGSHSSSTRFKFNDTNGFKLGSR